MGRTYRAVLRGGRIRWIDSPPHDDRPTPVRVTIIDEDEVADPARGKAMARALERLAQRGGIASIPDPVKWQRSIRDERSLPGRDS